MTLESRGVGGDNGLRALTPAIEDAIVAAVGRGVPLATAARAAGIGERTFRQWLSVVTNERTVWQDGSPILPKALGQLQRFAARVEQAAADCESRCAQAIVEAIGVVGKSGVPEWRPGLEFVKHSPTTRERWHEYRQVEVIHTDPFPELERVKAMSDDELMAEYERLNLPPGG